MNMVPNIEALLDGMFVIGVWGLSVMILVSSTWSILQDEIGNHLDLYITLLGGPCVVLSRVIYIYMYIYIYAHASQLWLESW